MTSSIKFPLFYRCLPRRIFPYPPLVGTKMDKELYEEKHVNEKISNKAETETSKKKTVYGCYTKKVRVEANLKTNHKPEASK